MLLRIFQIALATILCILIFAGLVEFLGVVIAGIGVLTGVHDPKILNQTPFFGALLWGLVFRGPNYTFFGTLPLLIIFLFCDWKKLSSKWVYIAVWILAGAGATLSLAGIPAGAISGFLYWYFVGKYAGQWKIGTRGDSTKHIHYFGRIAAYAVLLYLGYVSIGYVWYGYKMVEVTVSEPSRGVPAFISYREGSRKAYNAYRKNKYRNRGRALEAPELSVSHKVALRDFPDVNSCLKGSNFALDRLQFVEMAWHKINNKAEAEICTFRILKSLGGIQNATPFLKAQGFKSPKNFSSKNPYKAINETLSVHGSYSIRKNGPKFPTSGFIRRAFQSIPYGMSVYTHWSLDGTELLYVRYSFSTL